MTRKTDLTRRRSRVEEQKVKTQIYGGLGTSDETVGVNVIVTCELKKGA